MIKIRIDQGHGAGRAHNRGGLHFNEGDNNYYFSLVLKEELERYGGIQVSLVRTNINQDPSLATRAAMGRGYDLFLSVHSNAFSNPAVGGTSVFDSVEKPNRALATLIGRAVATTFKHNFRGVNYKKHPRYPRQNYYGVLRGNGAKSAMIIEHGFHTNPADSLFFRDNHRKIAIAEAGAIAQHYGLTLKTGASTPKPTPTTVWYGIGSRHNTKTTVQQLQKDLEKLGFSVGRWRTNGVMGPDTAGAIKAFQKKNNLVVDGQAGPKTLAAIKEALEEPRSTVRQLYRVRKDWRDPATQNGAFANLQNARDRVDKLGTDYKVFDWNGKVVYEKKLKPKPSPKWYGIGSPHNTKVEVQKLQNDLVELGFSVGSWGTNGVMGPDTAGAIKAFQRRHGLVPDSQAGLKTLAKIEEELHKKRSRPRVAVDGYLGPETIRGLQRKVGTPVDGIISRPSLMVRELQKMAGATVDGYWGPKTTRALQKHFKTPVDGKISKPSALIVAMQKWVNQQ